MQLKDRKQRQSLYKRPEKNKHVPKEMVQPPNVIAQPQETSSHFMERVLKKWHTSSTQEKIAYATLIVLGIGVTGIAMYHLIPQIVTLMDLSIKDSAANSLVKQPTYLEKGVQRHSTLARTNFFNKSHQDCLPDKIADIKISCADDFYQWLRQNSMNSELASVQEQIKIIKGILPSVIHPKLMCQIASDPSLKIEIVHRLFLQGSLARYIGNENKIYIAWVPTANKQSMKKVLLNELHSAVVRNTNFSKQSDLDRSPPTDPNGLLVSNPFINDNWQKDVEKATRLNEAITLGEERINNFIKIYKSYKNSEPLTHDEITFLDDSKSVIKSSYTPFMRTKWVTYDQYQAMKSKFSYPKDSEITCVYPVENLSILGPVKMYIYQTSKDTTSHGMDLRYSFGTSNSLDEKITSFITDYKMDFKMYDPNRQYGHLPKDEMNGEKSSHLQEYDSNLLKVFYPEWCDYFSEYHEIDDYCYLSLKL